MQARLTTSLQEIREIEERAENERTRNREHLQELCSRYSELLQAQGRQRGCPGCSEVPAESDAKSSCNKHSLSLDRLSDWPTEKLAKGFERFCGDFRLMTVKDDADPTRTAGVRFSTDISYHEAEDEPSSD